MATEIQPISEVNAQETLYINEGFLDQLDPQELLIVAFQQAKASSFKSDTHKNSFGRPINLMSHVRQAQQLSDRSVLVENREVLDVMREMRGQLSPDQKEVFDNVLKEANRVKLKQMGTWGALMKNPDFVAENVEFDEDNRLQLKGNVIKVKPEQEKLRDKLYGLVGMTVPSRSFNKIRRLQEKKENQLKDIENVKLLANLVEEKTMKQAKEEENKKLLTQLLEKSRREQIKDLENKKVLTRLFEEYSQQQVKKTSNEATLDGSFFGRPRLGYTKHSNVITSGRLVFLKEPSVWERFVQFFSPNDWRNRLMFDRFKSLIPEPDRIASTWYNIGKNFKREFNFDYLRISFFMDENTRDYVTDVIGEIKEEFRHDIKKLKSRVKGVFRSALSISKRSPQQQTAQKS